MTNRSERTQTTRTTSRRIRKTLKLIVDRLVSPSWTRYSTDRQKKARLNLFIASRTRCKTRRSCLTQTLTCQQTNRNRYLSTKWTWSASLRKKSVSCMPNARKKKKRSGKRSVLLRMSTKVKVTRPRWIQVRSWRWNWTRIGTIGASWRAWTRALARFTLITWSHNCTRRRYSIVVKRSSNASSRSMHNLNQSKRARSAWKRW